VTIISVPPMKGMIRGNFVILEVSHVGDVKNNVLPYSTYHSFSSGYQGTRDWRLSTSIIKSEVIGDNFYWETRSGSSYSCSKYDYNLQIPQSVFEVFMAHQKDGAYMSRRLTEKEWEETKFT
jgi:hypothetical protein